MIWIAALIGVCFGSFGNVLIERLPGGETIIGRSRCDGCKRPLKAYELIPLLSWLVLRGRCRTCGARIPLRVPAVEVFSGVLAVAAFLATDANILQAALFFVGLWGLLLIAVIDARTRTIPDVLTAVVFIAGIAFQWLHTGTLPVVAALVLAGFFLFQWAVSRGRWVGVGDILLAGAIGAFVGTPLAALWTLLAAYAFGAGVAVVLLALKKLHRGDMIPFGPFLVIGAYAALIMGDALPPVF